jgi:hypothetical protein
LATILTIILLSNRLLLNNALLIQLKRSKDGKFNYLE